jgi:drug/metabolite transporter (DMT)-like permease
MSTHVMSRGGHSPAGVVDDTVRLDGALLTTTTPVWLLMVIMVVVGTILPFLLLVGALRHISATRVALTAMFEPVAGTLVVYAWLGERFSSVRLVGGAIVLTAILLSRKVPANAANCGKFNSP